MYLIIQQATVGVQTDKKRIPKQQKLNRLETWDNIFLQQMQSATDFTLL